MTDFLPVQTPGQIDQLAALAAEIWSEHYLPLIGQAQVSYMLENFQSAPALTRQMKEEGYRYFFLMQEGSAAGYLGIKLEKDALFLSKLYVHKNFRGKGIARDAFAFVQGFAHAAGLARVYLTVNRGNEGSIRTYEKLGFLNAGELDTDIGGGFVMEDYVFEKPIPLL